MDERLRKIAAYNRPYKNRIDENEIPIDMLTEAQILRRIKDVFAKKRMEFLKQNQTEKYNRMIANGTLLMHLHRTSRDAWEMYNIVEKQTREKLPPLTGNFMEDCKINQEAMDTAESAVLKALIYTEN